MDAEIRYGGRPARIITITKARVDGQMQEVAELTYLDGKEPRRERATMRKIYEEPEPEGFDLAPEVPTDELYKDKGVLRARLVTDNRTATMAGDSLAASDPSEGFEVLDIPLDSEGTASLRRSELERIAAMLGVEQISDEKALRRAVLEAAADAYAGVDPASLTEDGLAGLKRAELDKIARGLGLDPSKYSNITKIKEAILWAVSA